MKKFKIYYIGINAIINFNYFFVKTNLFNKFI